MTVSTAPYYVWSNRSDWGSAPFTTCSPNLVALMAHLASAFGGNSLGCHNDRPIRGGTRMSTHAWGAALDPDFSTRARTVQVMDWLIAYSHELGINAIHDYETSRIWYPSEGWHSANIQEGDWIHVEVLPHAWGDGRPVAVKLAQVPPTGEIIVTEDDVKQMREIVRTQDLNTNASQTAAAVNSWKAAVAANPTNAIYKAALAQESARLVCYQGLQAIGPNVLRTIAETDTLEESAAAAKAALDALTGAQLTAVITNAINAALVDVTVSADLSESDVQQIATETTKKIIAEIAS